jgi:hypothetical protein
MTSSSVDERLGGTPSTVSNRWIVGKLTPARSANSFAVIRRPARAARIWNPVNIRLTCFLMLGTSFMYQQASLMSNLMRGDDHLWIPRSSRQHFKRRRKS